VVRPLRAEAAVWTRKKAPQQRRGRRPQPEGELLVEITDIIAGLPTYGYRRFTP
jgi:hypothetical protein